MPHDVRSCRRQSGESRRARQIHERTPLSNALADPGDRSGANAGSELVLNAMHRSGKFVHATAMVEGVRANPTLVTTPSQESVLGDDAWNRVAWISHWVT